MSKSGKIDKKMEGDILQFCGVTGASARDARRFLEKFKRLDVAMDAFYNDPNSWKQTAAASTAPQPSTSNSKLNTLFDKYKDPDSHEDEISIDGTIKMCEDLGVDPEDIVLLALAYELKSPRMGQWERKGWLEGWKSIGADTLPTMKASLPRLRDKLGSDPGYFKKVYAHTFDFSRTEGARSLGIEIAIAFWGLMLPHGLHGGALSHTSSSDDDGDDSMDTGDGWKEEYNQWWFEFLTEKGGKGVSKDTWNMFLDFIRTIDSRFEKYDLEAAWPSTIDDFVDWVKEKKITARA